MQKTSALARITPLILTYNEEANIARTLDSLQWARRIVIVDSGSTDKTLEIMASHPQAEVFERRFDTHAKQWNFGLLQIDTDWVLSLDADYVISPDLKQEMENAVQGAAELATKGFRIPFRYCIQGRPLRGTILPPRMALFEAGAGIYEDDGHTQKLFLRGRWADLKHPILHDDRKPLSRWLWAQNRYIKLEAEKLLHSPNHQLGLADKVRKNSVLAPFAVFFLCLIWQGLILDGWRGWFYSLQRLYAETLLALMLLERRLHRS